MTNKEIDSPYPTLLLCVMERWQWTRKKYVDFTAPDGLVWSNSRPFLKALLRAFLARKISDTQNHFHCDTSSSFTLTNFSAHSDQILVFPSLFTMESHLAPGLGGSAHKVKISCNSNYPWKCLKSLTAFSVLSRWSCQFSNVPLGLLINFQRLHWACQ